MKPADLRNATWREVQDHLNDDLVRVHEAYVQFGPGTTRAVSERSGISLLTFRPRTTDLFQLGLVKLVGKATGNEGVYAYVDYHTAGKMWDSGDRKPADPAPASNAPEPVERAAKVTAPEVNTLPLKDQLLSQIARLPITEQLSIAGTIRARAGHTPRATTSANSAQEELALA